MKVLYQRVLWNHLYEIIQDYPGNLFIFKNNYYWKPVNSIEEGQLIINSYRKGATHCAYALPAKSICASRGAGDTK